MNDPVFLDSAAFLRVWQRVTGEAGITTAPRTAGGRPTHGAAARLYLREGGRRRLLCRARAARLCTPQPARSARCAGARTAQSAANRVFLRTGALAFRLPPVRGRARRRRICAASIGRSLRSARSWMRQPMLRRCRSERRCTPWHSRTRATRSACARCSPD